MEAGEAVCAIPLRSVPVPTLYVARSPKLQKWGAEVGLTKEIYKLGLADDRAEAAIKALNADSHAGADDWRLVAGKETEATNESALIERLARRERMVDPALYPRIKGVQGIFKVRTANVERHLLMKSAYGESDEKVTRIKPEHVGEYLLHAATG